MSRFLVICRSCAHEQLVSYDAQGRTFEPNECRVCESDDIVELADLTKDELEELEDEVQRRRRDADD